jgi:hypothetical protein
MPVTHRAYAMLQFTVHGEYFQIFGFIVARIVQVGDLTLRYYSPGMLPKHTSRRSNFSKFFGNRVDRILDMVHNILKY